MKSFFQTLQEKHNRDLDQSANFDETPEYMSLAPAYLKFLKQGAMQRSDEYILKDLRELLAVPGITHVAFRDTGKSIELLLGTIHVYITDEHTLKTHDIGEFIIIINPAQKLILFKNLTGPLAVLQESSCRTIIYPHPHVYEDGKMCIDLNILHEYLTEGKIAAVTRILIRALHTVDEVPYKDARLSQWPLKGDVP